MIAAALSAAPSRMLCMTSSTCRPRRPLERCGRRRSGPRWPDRQGRGRGNWPCSASPAASWASASWVRRRACRSDRTARQSPPRSVISTCAAEEVRVRHAQRAFRAVELDRRVAVLPDVPAHAERHLAPGRTRAAPSRGSASRPGCARPLRGDSVVTMRSGEADARHARRRASPGRSG